MNENIEHLALSLPDQKNYEISYGLALKMAGEKLTGMENPQEICRKSGAVCQISGTSHLIILKYLNRTYQVSLPDITISLQNSPDTIELRDKILILHYLTRSRGTPLSNQVITYKELQEGAAYFPSFFKRAVKPLIDYFGQSPELLTKAAENLGGYKADFGDTAVTVPAFSRVPVTLVLWKGDDEFPPEGNILFDSTILDYLPVEDINVLCQTITWQLVKSLQAGGKK
jgi:hypothetical protein